MTSDAFRIFPAPTGSDPVMGARWVAQRPYATLQDVIDFADDEISVAWNGEAWALVERDKVVARHAELEDALAAGRELHETLSSKGQASILHAAGLSPADWRFETFRFVSTHDDCDAIHRSGERWIARIGDHSLSPRLTPSRAAETLADMPHLHSARLNVLEEVAGLDGFLAARAFLNGRFPAEAHRTIDDGLIEIVHNEDLEPTVRLTTAGREAIDGDPRTVPLAIRTRILELATPEIENRLVPDPIRRPGAHETFMSMAAHEKAAAIGRRLPQALRTHRLCWNHYFGETLNGATALGVRDALTHPWDLHRDEAADHPNEIVLVASGETPDGQASLRNVTIAAFEPAWAEDETSSLLVDTIVQNVDELRAMMRLHLGLEPEPSARGPNL